MSEIRVYHLRPGSDRIGFSDTYAELLDVVKKPPPPVLSKRDFYQRFLAGEFGNASPHWDTYEEWQASEYQGLIAIRTRTPGGRCDYFIPAEEVEIHVESFLELYKPEDLHFSAQCPEEDCVLRGEVMRGPRGLYLLGSTENQADVSMRQAMTRAFVEEGLRAHLQLKRSLCPNSWEWMHYLLDAYPDHVVEFTALRYPWGTVPGFNTLFWEVRKY